MMKVPLLSTRNIVLPLTWEREREQPDRQRPRISDKMRSMSSPMGQEEFQELSSFLKRFIRRFKFLKGVEGLCLTAICALLLFAVGPGVEQIKNFLSYAPLVYSVITARNPAGL